MHLCYPLCAKYSINKYVIFKQKNKNNLNSVHINSGEVGKIIKKLDSWDYALVDFSIKIPSRFKKLNTKFIAEKALKETMQNEAVFLMEKPKQKKSSYFFR